MAQADTWRSLAIPKAIIRLICKESPGIGFGLRFLFLRMHFSRLARTWTQLWCQFEPPQNLAILVMAMPMRLRDISKGKVRQAVGGGI
ncbi:MAG TPA: hypothetical protein VHS96_15525 [Bacteroidia bacterium]|nr:hypothetical protein [Bacteroidia bacterium]